MPIEIRGVNERGSQVLVHRRAADHNQLNQGELTMADANHSAPPLYEDGFVSVQESFQNRRTPPSIRFDDEAPPVLHLWMKLSSRWIEEAGFAPGQCLRVDVSNRRLVITPLDANLGGDCGSDGRADIDRATGSQQFSTMTEVVR
ncbi:SymE family type I addiction module toxin [Burkholderia anthina]|uniref:SymE family type I addiction module toxin n=1 Tax=Burkholderia anthina TaxID=179879 RepID=UPI001FB5D35D|nr:SymE family type I addiction module toxin [Burkholderia anthina]